MSRSNTPRTSPPMRVTRGCLLLLGLALIAGGGYAATFGSTPSGGSTDGRSRASTRWTTGTALAQRLNTPVGVTLGGSPLREGLYRFGRTQAVAVLLDRRIDPGQELDVTLNQVPLRQALHRIADAGDMGLAQLGPLFYFGPPPAAARLRTLAALKRDEVRGLPREPARRLAQSRSFRWDDLATPRDLLGTLAREGRFDLEGLDQVPHDLWAGADLPPLPLIDRLTLIAAQFDLTPSMSPDGTTLRLEPLPSEVAVVRRYPGGPEPEATAARLAQYAPDAEIRVSGGGVFVKGSIEEHEQISASRRPPRAKPDSPADDDLRHTRIERFAVEHQPVGPVLQAIASQLGLELSIDQAAVQRAGVSLEQRISIQGEGGSVDELLEEVCRAAGLAFRRKGRVVEIRPRE